MPITSSPEQPSDADVMAAVAAGDVSRLEMLFERHHSSVYGFLRRSSGSATLAEDLAQDVFLRALRYRASFDRERPFKPWLFRIARNVLSDHFSSARRTPEMETHEPRDTHPSAQRIVEAKEALSRLDAALARLSQEQREALLLARFHDLSYKEIGDVLGCTEGAVKARVFRALGALSAHLDDEPEKR